MEDNADIEQHTTVSTNGKLERIRTDRERYDGEPKYTEDSEISLEEIYDHIKMHYRKDTNCISLTSNANIGVNYGRGSYKDRYVMIKISKKEFGESNFEIKSTIIDKSNLNLTSLVIRLEFGNTSSSLSFLKQIKPEISVIMVGVDNDYGHPKKEILNRLKNLKTQIYRTDEDGTILITSDGNKCKVQTDK